MQLADRQMAQAKPLLIGERWCHGAGEILTSVNPATGEVNAQVSTACEQDIDIAVNQAHAALRETRWSSRLPHERADHLLRISECVLKHADRLAEIVMRENG